MLRDDVLLLLTEAEGYLSGEEMREKLGVSRAAVSQAVRALRADGYDIDAVTNRGYCLRARPDVLPYLPEARRATVQCFAQIDSTNSYLKAEAMRGAPDGLCAIADRQTAGRGRAGRPFRSDAGQGVYLSMLLRPNCAPTAAMTMTAHVAVAVCRALEACGVQPGIKWTNDLVLGTKKLCGILTELTVEAETGTVDSIVAGIGVIQSIKTFHREVQHWQCMVRVDGCVSMSREMLGAGDDAVVLHSAHESRAVFRHQMFVRAETSVLHGTRFRMNVHIDYRREIYVDFKRMHILGYLSSHFVNERIIR